jgi:GrpB-like predicted nucleotidyltransferase (UPF0157 family)
VETSRPRTIRVTPNKRAVIVVDYDPAWPRDFESLRQRIWPGLADVALRVEHVGSTSVPGLAAKPIIDMTIVVSTRDDVPKAIERLTSRLRASRQSRDRRPRAFDHPAGLRRHNLYVCPEGTIGVVNQVAVRDYLRASEAASMAP